MSSEELAKKAKLAISILEHVRDLQLERLIHEVVDHADDLADTSYLLNEVVDVQGTRIQLLQLLISQLEQFLPRLEKRQAPAPPPSSPPRSPRRRSSNPGPTEDPPGDPPSGAHGNGS